MAKKLRHRGDRATARDLFDLALVIEREPVPLAKASVFLTRHREQFLQQVDQRKTVLKAQFEAIDTLDYQPSYEQAAESVAAYLLSLSRGPPHALKRIIKAGRQFDATLRQRRDGAGCARRRAFYPHFAGAQRCLGGRV